MPNSIHVLTLDGGGMRGLYSASVLDTLSARFAGSRGEDRDIGKAFDLVVGTSTGAILAGAIAAGIPLSRIIRLYEEIGPQVFVDPKPPDDRSLRFRERVRSWLWVLRHLRRPGSSNVRLETELRGIFGSQTLGQLYRDRGIGLCLAATAFLQHKPRVFKTPHIMDKSRDNRITVAEACLASSAAPIYLPLASIKADGINGRVYVDGGLWANNPVLLGVIEGLALSDPDQPVVVLSVGTCPPQLGFPPPANLNRGVWGWRAGVLPLELAMNTQAHAARFTTTLLAEQLDRLGKRVQVLRCSESRPSPGQSHLLQLDSASNAALDLMKQLGSEDGHGTYRWRQLRGDHRGELLNQIFARMPRRSVTLIDNER